MIEISKQSQRVYRVAHGIRATIAVGMLALCAFLVGCSSSDGGAASDSTPAAPVDYRSAMVSRLTGEWGDSALAEEVVERVGVGALESWEERVPMEDVATTPLLSYHPDTTPAAQINTLVVFTFGYRGDLESETEPGPVNEQMAAEVMDFLAEYPVPVYAQTNVASLLQDAGVPQVTSIDRVVGPDGEITYLSTLGAAEAILAISSESGNALGIVGVVCFADHEGRCVLTAEAAGMAATAVEGIDQEHTSKP